MHNALNADSVRAYTKENYVIAHDSQSCFRANLRPQPIDLWALGDFLHSCMKKAQHPYGMSWAVLHNVVGYLFQVG
jgi:hypothetical protein